MKTNKMMRIASVLLVAVLLTTCVISGTFAKYTSTATSTAAKANVAKWDIKLDGTRLNNTFEFNPFAGPIYNIEYDGEGNAIYDTDNAEENVTAGNIAPGTWGKVSVALTNASEVTAVYDVDFTVTNASYLKFSLNGTDWVALADVDDTFDVEDKTLGTSADIVLYWAWDFTANGDANDTAIGEGADVPEFQAPTITVAVTVDQVN